MMGKLRLEMEKGGRGGIIEACKASKGKVNITFPSNPDTSKQTVFSECAKYHRHKKVLRLQRQ